MLNLLKTDLKRIFKDKLFFIVCMIGVGFILFTVLLYVGMRALVDTVDGAADLDLFGFDTKTLIFSSFSPMNNFGLILPIFISIIISKDFSYGTIRNKVIHGHSRFNIYLSILLSTIIVITTCVLGYTLLMLGFSSIFFDYSISISFGNDFGYFISSVLFIVLVYVFLSSLITFGCVCFKNVGIAIISYFGVSLFASIIYIITEIALEAVLLSSSNILISNILETINNLNIYFLIDYVIGKGISYSAKEVLFIVFDVIGFTTLISFFGILIFRKKDLK